ncbi:hypothetical protein Zm00014a_023991 [Zea mays]|uniref:Uncharacterized protein n=1 Tax=Zea mays TaxID=4577 RepID=A0A3L6ESP5_MAIZE|nr:hypothetical protein Zm00014a_023991 [Zea mays]PWZ23876.1 hypothetical protein Zm00014a_023991 [Zea mays]
MAIDLLRIHRIISTLLEIKGIIIAKYIKGRDNIQEITRSLLRAGEQELLCTLEEPMDEHCVRDSKDSVRTTIVEQDKVFRQQVHELHRLYHVQKSLMSACDNHDYQTRTEETHRMVQGSRSNLKSSPSTSGTNQSARLGNAQHSTPQQVTEDSSLHECKPVNCLSLFSEENSTVKERFHRETHKSVEDESWSASVESDLDLKLSIGPSSHSPKTQHWVFSGSEERKPSGQHR